MYLDLDVLLAELKADDWLASEVDIDALDAPKTSTATAIELQYAMEADWDRDRVVGAHRDIAAAGVQFVPLGTDAIAAAAELRSQYGTLNVFDGVHLGTARTLDEPIVSTDSLYPTVSEVDHVDPRDL